MSYSVFTYLLIAAWLVAEVYLLWLNYKGRFKYKLKEAYGPQKLIQTRIGIMILPLTLLCATIIIWLAPFVISVLFNIPHEVAFPSVVSGWLGLRVIGIYYDRLTIRDFENSCLICENKEECNRFLNEKCSKEYVMHHVRMATKLDKESDR